MAGESVLFLQQRFKTLFRDMHYALRTAAQTGFDPTGIIVNSAADLLRSFLIAPTRITAISPDVRFSTNAY